MGLAETARHPGAGRSVGDIDMFPAEAMMVQAMGPYSTATDMLAALRAKQLSSLELTDLLLTRIEERDGPLNAIPVRTPDRAREAARHADASLARGEWRPLLGLPITLKESTQAPGLPQSAGLPAFKDHRPTSDGPLATSVFTAGACLLGKTNVPEALSDWQANSTIYGRTNNPWDLARTPGGSTGGGGAGLAAGLTPSDIGGSIRVPAAYCGVYGHRPSETAIPRAGVFPRADLPNPAGIMAVQGPLARSAVDLELLFDVIAGPVLGEDAGWRLALPAARHDWLRGFRVAVMPTPPWVRPSRDMQGKVDELAQFLGRQGARVTEAMPALDFDRYLRDYLCLLMVQISVARLREEREARAKTLAASPNFMFAALAPGLTLDAAGLIICSNAAKKRGPPGVASSRNSTCWSVRRPSMPPSLTRSGPSRCARCSSTRSACPTIPTSSIPCGRSSPGSRPRHSRQDSIARVCRWACKPSALTSRTGRRYALPSSWSVSGRDSRARPATELRRTRPQTRRYTKERPWATSTSCTPTSGRAWRPSSRSRASLHRPVSGEVDRTPVTDRIEAWLRAEGVPFRLLEHAPVRTSEEAARVRGTPPEAGAKALVVRAEDRPVHCVLPGNLRVDNGRLRGILGVRTLRFATPAELLELTGCAPGAVPPFGNLFGLPVLVDELLLEREDIAFNAGSNSVSIVMRAADFARLAGARACRFAQESSPSV